MGLIWTISLWTTSCIFLGAKKESELIKGIAQVASLALLKNLRRYAERMAQLGNSNN